MQRNINDSATEMGHGDSILTSDGVRLHYIEAGQGPDLLLVPGWSQTAATWGHQIAEFSQTHHVIAVDHRGHGLSDKPDHGYRIARLTRDLCDLIIALNLDEITWVGHSMGCALAWSYWELFNGDGIERLVLADEPAAPVFHAHWPEGLAEHWGSTFAVPQITALVEGLHGPHGDDVIAELVNGMTTAGVCEADYNWLLEQARQMPREYASTLFLDHALKDWRDILPSIAVPTLVVGGSSSIFPSAAIEAIAEAMPRATARIISDRGSHFAFWENPLAFNREVREFLS
ncbi:alpha/beta fold hydrolase [Pseudonocardia xinjiangensis]|uniref:alpha/beta fold hydrolase n=1 Tax=Pseudonocardia xinjiangensis TaxID=75289 RepID=UPI003D935869